MRPGRATTTLTSTVGKASLLHSSAIHSSEAVAQASHQCYSAKKELLMHKQLAICQLIVAFLAGLGAFLSIWRIVASSDTRGEFRASITGIRSSREY